MKRNFGKSRLHTQVLIAEAINNNTRLWQEQARYGIQQPRSDPSWSTCFREPAYRSEAFFIALSVRTLRLAFKARAYYWSGIWLRKVWALQRQDGSEASTELYDDEEYDNAWLYQPD